MPERISTVDTAKMVRKVLAHAFPGVKFSVRSKSYSGGSSIDIHWTDGPRTKAVDALVKSYEGADFDGMQDLKTYHTTVLVGPNGPREVRFAADFVFSSRTETGFEALAAEAEAMIRSRCVLEGEGQSARFGGSWVSDLARGMVRALDYVKGTTLDDTFKEVVLREAVAA